MNLQKIGNPSLFKALFPFGFPPFLKKEKKKNSPLGQIFEYQSSSLCEGGGEDFKLCRHYSNVMQVTFSLLSKLIYVYC